MEDTLRYFFSAIFQGIAAILTLGAMFYMNYNDKTKTRIKELEKETYELFRPDSKQRNDVIKSNIIEVFIKVYSLPKYDNETFIRHNLIVDEYFQIIKKQNEIKELLPRLLSTGTILLLVSSLSLFLIGYDKLMTFVLFVFGLFTLLGTFAFLTTLQKIIIRSMELENINSRIMNKHFASMFANKEKNKD